MFHAVVTTVEARTRVWIAVPTVVTVFLSATFGFMWSDVNWSSHRGRTRNVITAVEQAFIAYRTDHVGGCPKSDDLFIQKYLIAKDAWGEQLVFTCPGDANPDGADIVSKGPDRILGTADDIRSWEPKL